MMSQGVDVTMLPVWPLVTYTEGIPDRLTLRIHSVYVHEVTRLSSIEDSPMFAGKNDIRKNKL